MSKYVNQKITERIIAKLENHEIPWRRPWGFKAGHELQNATSKRPYSGINVMLLSLEMHEDPRWLTFNQVKKLDGSIKGQRATRIVFYGTRKYENKDGEEKVGRFMRFFNVFNVGQVEGVDFDKLPEIEAFNPIERAEAVVNGYKNPPEVKHVTGDRAFYIPREDRITMPLQTQFENVDAYYSTLFHELGHSTGHSERCGRHDLANIAPFGSPKYSYEELVAEFIAALVCGYSGIETTVDNSVAYIKNWSKKLAENPDWVAKAAREAYTGSQFMLNGE